MSVRALVPLTGVVIALIGIEAGVSIYRDATAPRETQTVVVTCSGRGAAASCVSAPIKVDPR